MSELKINVIASYIGNAWTTGLPVLLMPIYIRILGAESWGVIAAFTTLQTILGMLDVGMGQVLIREIAVRFAKQNYNAVGDLLKTFERFYWFAGLLGAGFCYLVSDSLVSGWLNLGGLSPNLVLSGIYAVAVLFAVQWPASCYRNALHGIQKQVLLQGLQATFCTIRFGGAALCLLLYKPTIMVYLYWHIAISLFETFTTARMAWLVSGTKRTKSVYSREEIRKVRRFAGQVGGSVILGSMVVNLDKIITSKMLPISEFGYYAVASTVSLGILRFVYPLIQPLYAAFSQKSVLGEDMGRYVPNTVMFLSASIISICIVAALNSEWLLWLWSRNKELTTTAAFPLTLLLIGSILNTLYNVAYVILLARGTAKVPIWVNLASFLIGITFMPFCIRNWGVNGAAFSWLLINALGFVVSWGVLAVEQSLLPIRWLRPAAVMSGSGLVAGFVSTHYSLQGATAFGVTSTIVSVCVCFLIATKPSI